MWDVRKANKLQYIWALRGCLQLETTHMGSLADFSRVAFALQNNIEIETLSFLDQQIVAHKHFRLYSNHCLYSLRPSSGLSSPRSIGMKAESCAIACHSLKSLETWIRVHSLKAISQGRPEILSSMDSWSICTSIWTRSRGAQWLYVLGCFREGNQSHQPGEENRHTSPNREVYCCEDFQ